MTEQQLELPRHWPAFVALTGPSDGERNITTGESEGAIVGPTEAALAVKTGADEGATIGADGCHCRTGQNWSGNWSDHPGNTRHSISASAKIKNMFTAGQHWGCGLLAIFDRAALVLLVAVSGMRS